jgi:hypothetical protein
VLEDDVGVDPIESAGDLGERVASLHQADIADSPLVQIAAGLPQHRFRDIHPDHLFTALGQRNQDAADSAAKLEGALRREARIELALDHAHDLGDVLLATREERGEDLRAEAISKEGIVGDHTHVGLIVTEALPVATRVGPACPAGQRPPHLAALSAFPASTSCPRSSAIRIAVSAAPWP